MKNENGFLWFFARCHRVPHLLHSSRQIMGPRRHCGVSAENTQCSQAKCRAARFQQYCHLQGTGDMAATTETSMPASRHPPWYLEKARRAQTSLQRPAHTSSVQQAGLRQSLLCCGLQDLTSSRSQQGLEG